jgi:hypothetical protein
MKIFDVEPLELEEGVRLVPCDLSDDERVSAAISSVRDVEFARWFAQSRECPCCGCRTMAADCLECGFVWEIDSEIDS